LGHAVDKLA